jgi:anti-anti-sigma factor
MDVTNDRPAVELAGRLDGRCSAELRRVLYDHIERHPDEDVVLDVSRVESVDVTVFRTLAAYALRLEKHGHRVVLRGCSPALRRLIAFSGRRRLFVLERSRED